jgi:competence/damage-inducible protein CinA-like protein
VRAEIITIGTELLLGEIVDTNTAELARAMRSIGADLYRTTTVGDNVERIAQAVRESLARSDVVLTTGGLGPTVDDPTREAIAHALQVPTEFRPELWEQIQERFARFGRRPTANNRRQAYLPAGALALENPVGTAPGFLAEREGRVVIALPGVPAEMRHLLENQVLPLLRDRFQLEDVIEVIVLRTAGAAESWLDERIQDLERLPNPTVGVSAHPGRVDIRIAAKAHGTEQARAMIAPIEQELRRRLGEAVYGSGSETLEGALIDRLRRHGWRLTVAEGGTHGSLAAALTEGGAPFTGGTTLPPETSGEDLDRALARAMTEFGAQVGLGLHVATEGDRQRIEIALATPDRSERVSRSYGGPPAAAADWAVSLALDLLRRRLGS